MSILSIEGKIPRSLAGGLALIVGAVACTTIRAPPGVSVTIGSSSKKLEYKIEDNHKKALEGVYPITEKSHRQDRPCPCELRYDDKRQEFVGTNTVDGAGYFKGQEIFNLRPKPTTPNTTGSGNIMLEGYYRGRAMGDGGLVDLRFEATAIISGGKPTEIRGYVTGPIDPPMGYLRMVKSADLPKK